MTLGEVRSHAAFWTSGGESGLTFFMPILRGSDDLVANGSTNDRQVHDLVLGATLRAVDCLKDEPGAPHAASTYIQTDHAPRIYRQNDASQIGFNPNEEHAFIEAKDEGYVVWALRSDLNDAGTKVQSRPGVLVSYDKDGVRKMKYLHVVPTNELYSAFADTWCMAWGFLVPLCCFVYIAAYGRAFLTGRFA